MRRLPPLRALEAFTRVARLGSSKAAAAELALSAPALSRRIKSLEDHIGKPLFERRNQSMVLNEDGQTLLEAVAPALETIGEAVDQMHRHVLKGTRWLLLMGGGRNAGLAGPPGDTQAGPGQ